MRFFAVLCGLALLFSAMTASVAGMWMFDPTSLAIVIFGGSFYAVARGGVRQRFEEAVTNFGQGAVYWGWLAMLVGLIATGAHYSVERNPDVPAAVAIALLSVLYGYAIKFLVAMPLGVRIADTKVFSG